MSECGCPETLASLSTPSLQCVRILGSTYLKQSLSPLSRYLRTSVDIHRNDLFINKSLVVYCVDNPGPTLDDNVKIDCVSLISSQSDIFDQKECPKELYNETHNCNIQSDAETKGGHVIGFSETGSPPQLPNNDSLLVSQK
ncbi:hypothetical protein GLOIN_2v1806234 [Rhizophagus clarus]|nr:hypothetical protein GLOIN_2v1806234 [Rhizophagus clarus]